MKFAKLAIPGSVLIDLDRHGDERGFFMETYQRRKYLALGLDIDFVQDNRSLSGKNVLRGLHYQIYHPQGHLVHLMRGRIFDVGLDLRRDSPTFGQWQGVMLDARYPRQLFLPAGVAHGFCTLGEENEIYYKCTDYYYAEEEAGVLWNDPKLAIDWPVRHPIVHPRDKRFPPLENIPADRLPKI